MSKRKLLAGREYARLLGRVKDRIRQSQAWAVLTVNAELIRLYWDIGRLLDEQQQEEGYGTAVIPRLAKDLHNELPELKGFSERNIGTMIAFFRAYSRPAEVLQQAVAKPPVIEQKVLAQPVAEPKRKVLQQPVAKLTPMPMSPSVSDESLIWTIPWGHHALLLARVKDFENRVWYMRQTVENGWSRNVLAAMISANAHKRQGRAITNAAAILPPAQSDLVVQALKDPYIFDFLTLTEPFQERELETGLLRHLQRFLLELGQGFAFVGRQYRIDVGDENFYIDLLFYHLRLRCFVVIDLKKGAFQPAYAGKMKFYLNVIGDKLRHEEDSPSIGLILCQDHNRVVAEYALRGFTKPIGVSAHEITQSLPKELRSSLPSIAAIEAELGGRQSKSVDKINKAAKHKRRGSR